MFNLSLHIEYLMLRHDCVVLPGIGAFINVRQGARYNENTGELEPMTREVRFNSALTHDDGLLANSYARRYRQDFQSGRELLRKDLLQLQDLLENDGEITIGNLGILRKCGEVISFVPLYSAEHWAHMLGFSNIPFAGPHRDTDVSIKEAEQSGSSVGIYDNIAANTETEDKKDQTNNSDESGHEARVFNTQKNYYIAVNKIFAKVAASVLLAVVVVLSVFLPGTDRYKIDQASVVPVEKIIRETICVPTPSFESNTSKQSEPEPVLEEATAQSTDQPRYHLVVGTFMTLSEARKFLSACQTNGYEPEIVETPTRVRISAMSSLSREELQEEMRKESFRKTFPQSWIWEEGTK